jgi:hypothetical protein
MGPDCAAAGSENAPYHRLWVHYRGLGAFSPRTATLRHDWDSSVSLEPRSVVAERSCLS